METVRPSIAESVAVAPTPRGRVLRLAAIVDGRGLARILTEMATRIEVAMRDNGFNNASNAQFLSVKVNSLIHAAQAAQGSGLRAQGRA